jgi:hypothetical protein
MTETSSSGAGWTETDTETLFATIGRYVIIFQWIEGVLDQILLLAWGHENWADSQAKLAKMKNEDKVDSVKEVVLASPDFTRVHTRPEWCAAFESVIYRLHEERKRRNVIVHSQYLFEFADAGLAPLRSKRGRLEGQATFDQQALTKEVQEKLIGDVAQLAVDVNFVKVQLVHDYQAPVESLLI